MAFVVTYVGRRDEQGHASVFVEEAEARAIERPLPHVVKHSPTGLEWGYAGSGPADLALSILSHATGCPKGVAPVLYQEFKAQVVAALPQDSDFRLPKAKVMEWLDKRWSKMSDDAIARDLVAG